MKKSRSYKKTIIGSSTTTRGSIHTTVTIN